MYMRNENICMKKFMLILNYWRVVHSFPNLEILNKMALFKMFPSTLPMFINFILEIVSINLTYIFWLQHKSGLLVHWFKSWNMWRLYVHYISFQRHWLKNFNSKLIVNLAIPLAIYIIRLDLLQNFYNRLSLIKLYRLKRYQ